MGAEFVVIGSGIAGLSTAYHLALKGYRVKVIGEGEPTTALSSGLVTPLVVEELRPLMRESLEFYGREVGVEVKAARTLWITGPQCSHELPSGEAELSALDASLREGEKAYWIEEYIVDPGLVLGRLASVLRSLGVPLLRGRATVGGDGVVRVGGERVSGDVVVAAGPWSRDLLSRLSPAVASRLVLYRCQAAVIECRGLGYCIEDDSLGFYAVPLGARKVLVGDGSNSAVDGVMEGFRPDYDDALLVAEKAAARLSCLSEARLLRVVSAPCIAYPDGLPVVGEVREGVYTLTGLGGAGITLAPSLARLLVDHINAGGKINEWLEPHREITTRVWPPEPFITCPESQQG